LPDTPSKKVPPKVSAKESPTSVQDMVKATTEGGKQEQLVKYLAE